MAAKNKPKSGKRLPGLVWTLAGVIFAAITLLNLKFIFFGEDNLLVLYQLKQENQRMTRVITQLEQENEELRRHIDGLRNDPQIIEEEVRSKLNQVKEGEILYLDDQDN